MKYLAIDIGASSGRHIVGYLDQGKLVSEEVYRFNNGVKRTLLDGKEHLTWDLEGLLANIKEGIAIAKRIYPDIYSLAIDTWGVDYVLLSDDKDVAYSYRDSRCLEVIDQVHTLVPFDQLYQHTGCQFQSFNTIYQLYCDKLSGRLDKAQDMLMLPEYFLYKLTGNKIREYTNATTTGLVSVKNGEFDQEIIAKLNYPTRLFPKLSYPGVEVGEYEGIKCLLCATHDTASAVEGIPMQGNQPYISSGTWSLLGVKTTKPITDENSRIANYSNEGGVGYNRYQKNIMGMWLINELRKELCPNKEFADIVNLAKESSCQIVVDANDEMFLSPASMKEAFDLASNNKLKTLSDYFACAYNSLALSYKEAIEQLENNTKHKYEQIYIVGGGAKNQFLNELTQNKTGKQVIALPIEATALGNLKIQMEENNELSRS